MREIEIEIEIVVALDADGQERIAALAQATQGQFAEHMDPQLCRLHLILTLRPTTCPVEAQLLADAVTCRWFGVQARLASAEHLLWLWCRSDNPDHGADAVALIKDGTVDLYRARSLLRSTDDMEESGWTRLRLAIGEPVLSTLSTFDQYMSEKHARLDPNRVPVWRLQLAGTAESDN